MKKEEKPKGEPFKFKERTYWGNDIQGKTEGRDRVKNSPNQHGNKFLTSSSRNWQVATPPMKSHQSAQTNGPTWSRCC